MSRKLILRSLALIVVAISFSAIRLAAQDAPSVAEAARRARQQKQTAAKPVKVVDNDTLTPPSTAPTPPPSGTISESAAQAENVPAPAAVKKPATDSADDAKKKAEIEALKQEIADKKQSVNLLQREIALAQDSFYSNPDHEHDKAGKGKLDSMQSDLQQQQADLAELQAKLAELGGSEDSKPAPTPPQP